MTSMLPPTRDLPSGRQARIRADLERAVRGRRSRRLLVPVLAGAAAVAAVVASVASLRPDPEPVPAVQVTTSPPVETTPPDAEPGVPPDVVAAIEEGCARAAGVIGRAKLYQLRREETAWALLYTDNESLTCDLGQAGVEYRSGAGRVDPRWLPGHFSVEDAGAKAGGDRTRLPGDAGRPGYRTATGRVGGGVAKVTISADDRTIEARIVNGTYAARLYYPPDWDIPQNDRGPVIKAYDSGGKLLGTSARLAESCYFEPDSGTIIQGDLSRGRDRCQVATPWR